VKIKEYTRRFGIISLALFILLIVVNVITSVTVNNLMKPKIVSLDIKKTTDDFVRQTATLGNKITKEQLTAATTKFNKSLDESISEYSDKGYIVLVSPAVVKGARNVTPEVQANISKLMKEK